MDFFGGGGDQLDWGLNPFLDLACVALSVWVTCWLCGDNKYPCLKNSNKMVCMKHVLTDRQALPWSGCEGAIKTETASDLGNKVLTSVKAEYGQGQSHCPSWLSVWHKRNQCPMLARWRSVSWLPPSLKPPQVGKKADSCRLPSDFHVCPLAHAPSP